MKKMMIVLIGLSLVGCGENDFGGDDIGQCEYEETAVAWDEEADNGVVPEDLLAFAETTATSISATGPDGEAEISMEIVRSGDSAFFMESDCGDRLEIPLTVSFATSGDDALDEEMEIRAIEENGSLMLTQRFELEDLSGTFTPTIEEDRELTHLSFDGFIMPNGSGTGEIGSYTQSSENDDLTEHASQNEWSWEW